MTFIGDVVAREEEYLNGKGTFVDDEGNIRATVIGKLQKDDTKKEISVIGKLNTPNPGDIAICLVSDVKDKIVLMDVEDIKGPNNEKRSLTKKTGIVFIANLSQSYLENPRQALKIGDLVKAQVVDEDATAYILTLKDQSLGVIIGLCSKCRSKLIEKGKDMKLKDCSVMVCSKCKAIETRKTAKDYIYKGDLK